MHIVHAYPYTDAQTLYDLKRETHTYIMYFAVVMLYTGAICYSIAVPHRLRPDPHP